MTEKKKNMVVRRALAGVSVLAMAAPAYAAPSGSSGGAPWEGALSTVANSFTGPVAYAVALIAFVVAAASYMWSGDLNGIAKVMVRIIVGISVLVGVVVLMNEWFGIAAAAI